jgi:DNA-directed RNA polymerase specialized sigma24 family protein
VTAGAVNGCRQHGFSDGEIAQRLGVSRQNVRQRWPRPDRDKT